MQQQSISATSIINPDKCGYMTKQGGLVKSWKRRWFILKDNELYYFRGKADNAQAGVILLDNTSTVNNAEKKLGKKNCFEITTKDRTYYLYTDTHQDYEEWVAAITQASKYGSHRAIITHKGQGEALVLSIKGMMCERCVLKVRGIIAKAQGVTTFDIDPEEETAVIKGDNIDVNELITNLEDAGFLPSIA
jgi:copper chaperone CopZ